MYRHKITVNKQAITDLVNEATTFRPEDVVSFTTEGAGPATSATKPNSF